MKLPHGYRICVCCGHRYRPCRFNAHHQDYCDRPECQFERKRKRDRERYRRKYQAGDKAFCNREKARRCAASRGSKQNLTAEFTGRAVTGSPFCFAPEPMPVHPIGGMDRFRKSDLQRVLVGKRRKTTANT